MRWAHGVCAARARATLGEISSAMEEAFDRYATVPTPVKGVYAAPYRDDSRWAQVIDGVKAVERRLGRAPKLLIAKMGQDGHDRGRSEEHTSELQSLKRRSYTVFCLKT